MAEQKHQDSAARQDFMSLRETLRNTNPVDIAASFEKLDDDQMVTQFRMLSKDAAADVFSHLSRDSQEGIVNAIQDHEISDIIDDLFLDDAVDFIDEMPANVVKRVLLNLPKSKRNMINRFLQYPEGSAGSIMTIEFVDLKEFLTVEETFARIRAVAVDKETIYTCYVIDAQRHLLGAVSAKTLLLASPEDKIGEIMDRDIIYAVTSEDVESLAKNFRKYALLAMPIVDNENRLVGIVTVDDVLAVQEEKATEDFEIMAAMSPSDEPYLKTGVLRLIGNRLPWLIVLMLTATITGMILKQFETALEAVPILITCIPMLMNTGGSGGSQASTLVIRGLALGEIKLNDILKILWKELRVAFVCGFALALINFLRILIMFSRYEEVVPILSDVGITVSLALWVTVVIAKIIGCLLPLGAKLLKLDPAVMATPAIATFVDASSLLVLFTIARHVFGI